jgi:N-acetylglucosaminyl-diphospho-decaprenol L-rhamnosyltransferase
VSVAAVVVAHGPEPELAECVNALAPQVDELVLVANAVRRLPSLPVEAQILQIERSQGYAANANRGIAATTAPFVVVANTDTIAEPTAVEALYEFASSRPRCGIAGPELRYPDGTWQASRRRFPTVAMTMLRRPPLRFLFDPERWQRSHYLLDDRSTTPVPADWMMGAFLLLRREMLDELGSFDEGFRLYGEDIDLCYRAAKAGWERWFVPEAVVHHTYAAVIDHHFLTRETLWHWRSMARFARKHPERLLAL